MALILYYKLQYSYISPKLEGENSPTSPSAFFFFFFFLLIHTELSAAGANYQILQTYVYGLRSHTPEP